MKNIPRQLFLILAIGSLLAEPGWAQFGNDNPTGVTGEHNGSVTTAGSYDPYTGNAKRFVDDLTVTGSIGAYPLKWTRVLNTRAAAQWSHSYAWSLWVRPYRDYEYFPDQYEGPGGVLNYPDGRTLTFAIPQEPYTYWPDSNGKALDGLEHVGDGNFDLWLHDGGKVRFRHPAGSTSGSDLRATEIVDPHGQTTYLIRDSADRLWQIREPGGRYLQMNYTTYSRVYDGETVYWDVVSSVQAFSAPGQLTETVTYNYNFLYVARLTYIYLTQANYDDGTHAFYTYEDGAGNTASTGLIQSCDDVRFGGPMKRIKYEYATANDISEPLAIGQIKAEKNLTTGQRVSELIYPRGPFNLTQPDPRRYRRTERKGDGATREFQYSTDWTNPELESYTDFKNQRSYITHGPGSYTSYFKYLTDALGRETAIEKNASSDKPKTITHPDGSTIQFTYTDAHQIASRTGERGNTTYYDRDGYSRIWRIRYPNGGVEQFSYNEFGQVLTHKLTSGGTETFEYDYRGRKTAYYPPATESDPAPWNHKTLYFYYESGPNADRLLREQDPRGNSTSYEYNLRGQVTKVTQQDGTYNQSQFNPDGTLAWTADENHPGAATDPNQRTRYTYDEYKRVLTVTNPMNETTITSYAIDPAWANPLLHTTNSVKYVISPGGKSTVFDYDANFRKTSQVAALGTADEAWTLFEYDAVGNLIKTTDPRFYETRFGYDARNRKIWMDTPIASDRNSSGHTMNREYDGVGNKLKETRADGAFRSWDYDSMNRVWHAFDWRYSDPSYQITTYEWNTTGTYHWITDAKNSVYTFISDALGRKLYDFYPADQSGVNRLVAYWYDAAGNLTMYKNPADEYRHFSYDERNRQRHSWWNSNAGPEIVTNYDAASRMTNITTNNGETSVAFYYDEANRKTWEDQTVAGLGTRWVYTPRDVDGNRRWLQSGGYYFSYEYTQRNQLARIRDGANSPVCEFTYDASGNMTQRRIAWFSSSPSNFQYDASNRVTMFEDGNANSGIYARSHYQYDTAGREAAVWRDEDGSKGDRFSYSANNQLTAARYKGDWAWAGPPNNPERSVDYAYRLDMLNRQSVTENGAVTNYAVTSGMNQYPAIGDQSLSHDDHRFNLTGYHGATFTYNAQNQLIAATKGGNSAQFIYDGLGRCVRRTINGATRFITYDDWNPIYEWDASGNAVGANFYGAKADEIIGRWDSSWGFLFYKQDSRGNVVFLTNGSGDVIEKYSYDAFGKPKIMDWSGNERAETLYGNRFMFTGREWIAELGIYDYRNRMYHPGLGRFLQTDPIGFAAGDMNLFRYCGDDPVDRSDPTGLIAVDDRWSRLMYWQGNAQETYNQIAEAYRNWQPAGMSGGLNINWHGLVGMNNAARIDNAMRTGPSVYWEETGDENISQPYVYSDKGARLPARTFTEINVVGERYKGKLIGLYVNHNVDVKYASTAGPNTRKWARDVEPAHRNELRAWGLDSGRDIARGIASKYRNDPQRAVNEANTVLKNELRKQAEQSHLYHDYGKPIGIGDHISKYPYEW